MENTLTKATASVALIFWRLKMKCSKELFEKFLKLLDEGDAHATYNHLVFTEDLPTYIYGGLTNAIDFELWLGVEFFRVRVGIHTVEFSFLQKVRLFWKARALWKSIRERDDKVREIKANDLALSVLDKALKVGKERRD